MFPVSWEKRITENQKAFKDLELSYDAYCLKMAISSLVHTSECKSNNSQYHRISQWFGSEGTLKII